MTTLADAATVCLQCSHRACTSVDDYAELAAFSCSGGKHVETLDTRLLIFFSPTDASRFGDSRRIRADSLDSARIAKISSTSVYRYALHGTGR
jgi:hypothetical protein